MAASDVSKPVQGRKDSASGTQHTNTEAAASSSSEAASEQPPSSMNAADGKESQPTAEAGSQETETKAGGRNNKPDFGQPVQEGHTAEETKNSQVQESDANPASSSETGSGRGKGSKEEELEGREEEEQGPVAPEVEGGDEEGALPKPATGQEEDEGPEATGELCSCAILQLTTVKVSGQVFCCAGLGWIYRDPSL